MNEPPFVVMYMLVRSLAPLPKRALDAPIISLTVSSKLPAMTSCAPVRVSTCMRALEGLATYATPHESIAKSSHERPDATSVALPAAEPSVWSYYSQIQSVDDSCQRVIFAHEKVRAHFVDCKCTYGNFIHFLRSRVSIEQGVVLSSDPVDAEPGKGCLIRGTSHGWIFNDKVRLAGLNVKFPNTSQLRISYEEKMVIFMEMSHAVN